MHGVPAEAEKCPATVVGILRQYLFWGLWPPDDKSGPVIFCCFLSWVDNNIRTDLIYDFSSLLKQKKPKNIQQQFLALFANFFLVWPPVDRSSPFFFLFFLSVLE